MSIKISQENTEYANHGQSTLEVTQEVTEIADIRDTTLKVSQLATEVLSSILSTLLISQLCVEVAMINIQEPVVVRNNYTESAQDLDCFAW